MGTTYGGLYQPAVSEVGWSDEVNANFTTIADWHLTARSMFLPASQGFSSSGAAPTNVGGTFPASISGFPINNAVTSGAYWVYMIPDDADGVNGTTFRPVWSPTSTDATAHTIRWSRDLTVVSGGGSSILSGGTVASWTGDSATRTANLTYRETGGLHAFPAVAGTWLRLNLSRVGGDALDTLTVNAVLLGVQIDYTGA